MDGCRRSCLTSELAIAGTAKPTAAPLHASAASARQPICEGSGAIACLAVVYRRLSPAEVVTVGRVSIPVWLELPFATRRMMVPANASTTRMITVATPTARPVELRRCVWCIGPDAQ
jgi:hypothetical protein